MSVLCNGRSADAAFALNRGLYYGDGVFRSVLVWNGEPLEWNRHLQVLSQDASRLGMDAPPADIWHADLAGVSLPPAAVLKLMAVRRHGERGYAPQSREMDRWLIVHPAPVWRSADYRRGIRSLHSPVVLGEQPLLAGIKHLNRLEQVLASRDWPVDIDEALMFDAQGHVICATRGNLFVHARGAWLTPQLDRCGVNGVTRRRIIESTGAQEARIDVSRLAQADEVLVCNAVSGIRPLRSCGELSWPAPGPATRALMQALPHPAHRLEEGVP